MTTPIPKPPGVPLLGNIFDVNSNNTWDSLKTLAEKYGEIFKITVLGHTIVFVASAALAEEICDETRFRKYVGGPIIEIRAAVNDSLFTAYDNEASWGIAHRIIAPKLTAAAVAERFDEMRDTAAELLALWKGLDESSNSIAPLTHLNRLNLETSVYTLFGQRLNSLDKDHPWLQAMEDSTSEAMKRPVRPGFLNWLVHGRKFKSSIKTMRGCAAEVMQHRKDNPTDRQDLLATLLTATDPETGAALTESQVIDEVVTMPIGSSTAPCLLTSLIYFLARNPDAQARARAEIDTVLPPGETLQAHHLERMPYLQGVVRESLRLSSAAPGFNIEPLPRQVEGGGVDKSPIFLGGGKYQVAHNQAMIIVLPGVNRDAAVFDEPLAFRPERMMGEAFEQLPAGTKKWFGNGKRVCIGQHYAMQWSVLVACMMIREVDFEMVDEGYKAAIDGWFNIRLVDFKAKVKPRAA
ncbi:Bifunctional P-450:NADPH-P450 reductase [Escovopsis weberi]|uniref:Bifunctional P-450:NADPH-P450 reductase n=1 Tax=Escovopsis weberi TaxID=150374 RepID=A0A0M9VUQ3_ESCWE|nr:Bifunctional P-450:NADPH-P450 reductase [Escovopsis weberi]